MKKKSWIVTLAVVAAAGFAVGAGACSESETESAAEINGFEVAATLEVNVGAAVELEQPLVTDEDGNLLDYWTYVTDSDGNYVATTAGMFSADDMDGYIITYVVRDTDNATHEKKTVVSVKGAATVSGQTTLDVDYEQFVTVGEPVEIDAVCSDASATFTYTVKKASSGEAVTVDGNAFTPTEKGVYEVKVATDDGVSYTYNIFAQAALQKGEVETFDEAWIEREAFVGGKRQDWDIVTSEDCGLLDPYGNEAAFATYSTEREYIPLFINIREDLEYYEQLIEEGYTYVSMWIYMESSLPHMTISDRDPNGGFYRREGPDLYPGVWTEFQIDLATGDLVWYRSFTQCYNMYDEQNHFFLQVDNSYEYNVWGGGDSITFYFTDIYAVKPVEVAAAENVETAKNVGDSVDLSALFTSEHDLQYAVGYRGETKAVDAEYTFTANGEYVVTATPASYDLRGSASVTLVVDDEHTLSGAPVIKERTADGVTVNVSELNAQFDQMNGVTPTISAYNVSYNGEAVTLTDGAFTATKDGAYTVEVCGAYEKDGAAYTTYQTLTVDVWSTATKYAVIDTNNIRSLRAWDWDSKNTTATYGEYTVGGRTGDYICATVNNGQSLTTYAKPMYSKAYYEAIFAQEPTMQVRVSLYFEPGSTGKITNFMSVFTSTSQHTTWGASYENNWLTFSMTLENFIAQYDTIAAKYEEYKNASFSGGTSDSAGSWLYMIGSQVGRTVYMDVRLGKEATEASVALKAGKGLAVDTDNDLTELLDITLDGQTGVLSAAEVYFNGEWVALDGMTFAPAWATSYEFRFLVETADGVSYKTVTTELTVGDGAFTVTADTDVHTLKAGETFDVATLLEGGYTYELEAFASRGTSLTAIELEGGMVLDGDELEAGSYLINVYAIKGEGKFGKILYYTFTLDHIGEADPLTLVETPTTENKKTLFQSYQWAVQNLTDTTVTSDVPAGNSGSFLKYEGTANNTKEAMKIVAKPLFSKGYYQSLANSGKSYIVKYDVYVENVLSTSTRTTVNGYVWNSNGEYKSGTRLAVDTWHYFSVPLETIAAGIDDNGEVDLFGVYIGSPTSDLVRFYVGNIRIEEAPMMWSATPLTTAMLTSYQYTSSQNLTDISLTTEIPSGGVAGTYVKYAQTVSKEDIQLAVAPVYTKEYYEALLESGKNYMITYDVYVEVSNDTCTTLQTKLWFTNSDDVQKFATHGTIGLDAWYTVEIDLQYLVDNWGNYRLFGLCFTGQSNFDRSTDRATFYLGNIQLVEGEASGVATLKTGA